MSNNLNQSNLNEYQINMNGLFYPRATEQTGYTTPSSSESQYNPYYPSGMQQNSQSSTGTSQGGDTTTGNGTGTTSGTGTYSSGQGVMGENQAMGSDIGFTPFTGGGTSMQNAQQPMGQSGMYPYVQELKNFCDALSKADLTKMPFIPNPYYMLNMANQQQTTGNDGNTSTEAERDPKKSYKHYNYYASPYPYYNLYYNMYPYEYYNPVYYNQSNPLLWLALASMFKRP